MMQTDDLDFELPPELIAQVPTAHREQSRLLCYRRSDQSIAHRLFSELPSILSKGDLLVFNDAKVLPARFVLRKSTGGRVEGLFLSESAAGQWKVLLRNLGPATELQFDAEPSISCRVTAVLGDGVCELSIATSEPAGQVLSRLGRMPLPPYIKREKENDPRDDEDRRRYQTVYARNEGSIAAPTAGLHFTQSLLGSLDAAGVRRASVTLDVGIGTFKPVTAATLDEHQMHSENYSISGEAAALLNEAQSRRRRIIAVGTTSARVLESQPARQPFREKRSETNIFIKPPYAWKHIDGLITNFHLPRSTLIALVAALVGLEEQRRIYQTGIKQRYRFFSYGDAMFIE